MAEKLAKGASKGAEYQEIIRQKSIRSSLIDRLSQIGKDREGGALTNLTHVWVDLLDHVYAILSLIKL